MSDTEWLAALCLIGITLGLTLGMAVVWFIARRRVQVQFLPQIRAVVAPLLEAHFDRLQNSFVAKQPPARDEHETLMALTQSVTQAVEQALQRPLQAETPLQAQVNKALQRIEQLIQQATQIEREYRTKQHSDREQTQAWGRLQALVVQPTLGIVETTSPPMAAAHAIAEPAMELLTPAAKISMPVARPPDVLHLPLPRPTQVFETLAPVPELSDEELDALPPDLPAHGKPRKRILAAPKKPVLRSL